MDVKEAAQRLGKSDATIRRWIRQGKLNATLIKGKYDIEELALNSITNPEERRSDSCEERGLIELECLLNQNADLSKRIAAHEVTIQNQKMTMDLLLSQLTSMEKRLEKVGGIHRLAGAQNVDIGSYTRKYSNGEVVVAEGDTSRDVYFIVSGMVEISQYVAEKRMIITTLKNGDFFGEMAALTGYSRSMTAMAKGNLYLWKLSASEMHEYMRLRPQIAIDMCISMSERLGHNNLLLRDLANRIVVDSGDEYNQTMTLNYLHQKLKEKSEQLEERNKQISQLNEKLKLLMPSPFLRGLSSRIHRVSKLITHPDS